MADEPVPESWALPPGAEEPDPRADGLDSGLDGPVDEAVPRISVEEVHAYTLQESTRVSLGKLLRKRLPLSAVDDLIQETLIAASRANARPKTTKNLPAWTEAIAERLVAQHYKRRATAQALEDSFVMRFESSTAPVSGVRDEKLMAQWLFRLVENDAHDAETLDVLRDHVINGRSYDEIAALRRMDPKALENRVAHFKAKYKSRRKEYLLWLTRLAIFSTLLVAGVALALYYLVTHYDRDVSGSIAPPRVQVTPTSPIPAPSVSSFRPAERPVPAPAPPQGKAPH